MRDLERLVRPTGEGIDLPDGYALFGKTYAETAAALQASLGRATKDSGVVSNESEYGTCPGTKLRALEFGGGALRVLFGDVERPGGPLTLFQWALTDKGDASVVPRATAFISKEDRLLVGIGTTVEELSASVPKAQLELIEAEGSFRPAFALSDGTTYGLFGSLSSTRPSGTVVFVLGGMDCRE